MISHFTVQQHTVFVLHAASHRRHILFIPCSFASSQLHKTEECICRFGWQTCCERSTSASYWVQTVSEIFKNTRYFKREACSCMGLHCCQNGSQRSAIWLSVFVPVRIAVTRCTFMHLYRFPECKPDKDVAGTRKTHYGLLNGRQGKKKVINRYKDWMRMKRLL